MRTKPIISDLSLTASRFQSSIVFLKDQRAVDAKSIMGLYSVWADQDPPKTVYIEGPDKDAAKSALSQIFALHSIEVEFK